MKKLHTLTHTKRILSVLLAAMLAFSALSAVSLTASAAVGDSFSPDGNVTYRITSGDTVEIFRIGNGQEDVVIPENVRYKGVNYRVTGSAEYFGFFATEMKTCVLPSTLETLADNAFCDALNEITINSPVKIKGGVDGPFSIAYGLDRIFLNDEGIEVEDDAFDAVNKDNSTYMKDRIYFYGYSDYYRVAGSEELCGSGWDANDNDNLMEYNEDKSRYEKVYPNVYDGTYEFKITKNGEELTDNNTVTVDGSYYEQNVTIWYNPKTNESGAEINPYLLSDPDELVVTKQDGAARWLASRRDCGFVNYNLSDVQSGERFTSNGFKFEVHNGGDLNYNYFKCAYIYDVEDCAVTELDIPGTVEYKGTQVRVGVGYSEKSRFPMFRNCQNLKSVTVGEGANSVAYNAFKGCSSLEDITFYSEVKVNSSAFEDCTALKNVCFYGQSEIGSNAFKNCGSLRNVYFHGKTVIHCNPFDGCNSLKSLCFYNDEIIFIPYNMIGDINDSLVIYGNEGSTAQNIAEHFGYGFDTLDNVPSPDETDPTDESTEPTSESTEPTSESTEPTSESTEPTSDSSETTSTDETDYSISTEPGNFMFIDPRSNYFGRTGLNADYGDVFTLTYKLDAPMDIYSFSWTLDCISQGVEILDTRDYMPQMSEGVSYCNNGNGVLKGSFTSDKLCKVDPEQPLVKISFLVKSYGYSDFKFNVSNLVYAETDEKTGLVNEKSLKIDVVNGVVADDALEVTATGTCELLDEMPSTCEPAEVLPSYVKDGKVEYKLGDCNGDGIVNVKDATLIQQYAVEMAGNFDDMFRYRANANGDGNINVKDATLVMRASVEQDTGYPIGKIITENVYAPVEK